MEPLHGVEGVRHDISFNNSIYDYYNKKWRPYLLDDGNRAFTVVRDVIANAPIEETSGGTDACENVHEWRMSDKRGRYKTT